MKILFAGNPSIAVPCLLSLLEAGYEVAGVLVNADAPKGRGRQLVSSAVKEVALQQGLAIFDPAKLTLEVEQSIAKLQCDMMVCFAYGKIFNESFLGLFKQGAINIHPSLLPLYRGPTPIQAALLAGDSQSGITIQRMALKMDAGDVIIQQAFSLKEFAHGDAVAEYVAGQSALLLRQALERLAIDSTIGVAQDERQATYCGMLDSQVGRLNFNQHTAAELYNRVRAFSYEPGAFCYYLDRRLLISHAEFETSNSSSDAGRVLGFNRQRGLQVQAKDGYLWVKELQLAGKKRMDASSFFNGNRDIIGKMLT